MDPERIQQRRRAYADNTKTYLKRASQGELRWVYSIFPTSGHAHEAEVSLDEYERFVYAATYADRPDPIAEWEKIARDQKGVVDWLVGKSKVELKGEHVDLSFSIDGRTFVSCDGRSSPQAGKLAVFREKYPGCAGRLSIDVGHINADLHWHHLTG